MTEHYNYSGKRNENENEHIPKRKDIPEDVKQY